MQRVTITDAAKAIGICPKKLANICFSGREFITERHYFPTFLNQISEWRYAMAYWGLYRYGKFDLPHYKEQKRIKRELYCKAYRRRPERLEAKRVSAKLNRAKSREHERQKARTDPIWRLKKALRRRTRKVLMLVIGKKEDRTSDLLGCTVGELKKWLEHRFTKGMTWENYGQWHIDHVIPLAKFDLHDLTQRARAFHFTNLQPLWALENCSKRASMQKQETIPLGI